MIINTPEPTLKSVTHYDFQFDNGSSMSATIDSALGDTIEETSDRFVIVLAEKPAKTNPSVNVPREDTVIYINKLLAWQKREQLVMDLPADQNFAWKKDTPDRKF